MSARLRGRSGEPVRVADRPRGVDVGQDAQTCAPQPRGFLFAQVVQVDFGTSQLYASLVAAREEHVGDQGL